MRNHRAWRPFLWMHSISDRLHPMLVEEIVLEILLLVLDHVSRPQSWHTLVYSLVIRSVFVTYNTLTRFRPEEAPSVATRPTDHQLVLFMPSRIRRLPSMSWSMDAPSWDRGFQDNINMQEQYQRWSQIHGFNSVTSSFTFPSGDQCERALLRSSCGPSFHMQAIHSNNLVRDLCIYLLPETLTMVTLGSCDQP